MMHYLFYQLLWSLNVSNGFLLLVFVQVNDNFGNLDWDLD